MPKKTVFERDLVRVNISRKCHDYLLKIKQHGQPFYSVIDRVVGAYKEDDESRVWEDMYNNQVRITQDIMARNKVLEEKLNKIMTIGVQTQLD